MKYKVIDRSSVYYERVGEELDKFSVYRRVGYDLGRSLHWYQTWDVLLKFPGGTDDGLGFKWSEVEKIDDQ